MSHPAHTGSAWARPSAVALIAACGLATGLAVGLVAVPAGAGGPATASNGHAGQGAAPARTATTATVRTPGIPLNVRSGPATRYQLTRRIPNRSRVGVECRTRGQSIRGTVTSTATWARLSSGGYASAAYLAGLGDPPVCRGARSAGGDAVVRTPGIPLAVRGGPGTGYRLVRRIPNRSRVAVACRAQGQPIRGTVGTTATWARLSSGGYASAAYLSMPGGLPRCRAAGPRWGPPPSPAEFLRRASTGARRSDQRYGIPASVTIAQAMLESGWGTSGLAMRGNNYFGIKCIGGTGPIAVGCQRYRTFECDRRDRRGKKRCYHTYAWFRAYRSVTDSFHDHARLLVRADRYRTALRHRHNPDRFAVEVHRAGYATDPRYARKLISLMRTYRLYRFD